MQLKRDLKMLVGHPRAVPPLLSTAARSATVHVDRARSDGRSGNPKGISLIVTKLCNLNCSMCHYAYSSRNDVRIKGGDGGQRDSISLEIVERFAEEWRGRKPYISLTGGEPTLHRRLGDIVRTLKRGGFSCILVSNGARLAEMAEELVEARVDIIALSLDGDRCAHDEIRGVRGTFDRAVASIRAIVRAREKAGGKVPLVFINSAVSNGSAADVPALVRLANDVGASGINFQHLWMQTEQMVRAHNESVSELPMSEVYELDIDAHVKDVDHLAKALQDARNKHPFVNVFPSLGSDQIRTYYDEPERFVVDRPTRCSWLYATIQPDGRLTQCKEHVMGSLADASFEEVWNGERFREFRRIALKHASFPICARCCHYFKEW